MAACQLAQEALSTSFDAVDAGDADVAVVVPVAAADDDRCGAD